MEFSLVLNQSEKKINTIGFQIIQHLQYPENISLQA